MASLTNQRGRRFIQFPRGTGAEPGKRATLSLGRVSERAARVVLAHVEHILSARTAGHAVPPATSAWLAGIGDKLHARLAELGLATPRGPVGGGLAAFLDATIDARTDLKPNSTKNLKQTRNKLVKHFGAERDIASITRGDAIDWQRAMKAKHARATVSGFTKKARELFAAAVDKRLIAENPFKAVKAGRQSNEKRQEYVPASDVLRVIDRGCRDAEERTLFALARFGGLRIPSEAYLLKWSDVDFDAGRMTVWSPKTEHHEGRESRKVPLFADLRPYLDEAFLAAPDGTVYVLHSLRHTGNPRTRAEKIIRRAGLEPWPKLFQNLRASCETDLMAVFPIHVVCAWIGNSEAVAKKHYLIVTDADFERAANGGGTGGSGLVRAAPGAAGSAGGRVTKTEPLNVKRPENPGVYELNYPQGTANLPAFVLENLRVSEKALHSALQRVQFALPHIRHWEILKLQRAVDLAKSAGGGR